MTISIWDLILGISPRARSAALMAAVALLVAGCGSSGSPAAVASASPVASPSAVASSSATVQPSLNPSGSAGAAGYPAGWHTRAGLINPSGNRTVLFAGPRDLPSECREDASGSACFAWPIMTLGLGEIVVAWRDHGMPGSVAPTGGTTISAGGRSARFTSGPADESCAAIGGDESIAVVIVPTAGQLGWQGIDACIAGPDRTSAEAAFRAIIASASMP